MQPEGHLDKVGQIVRTPAISDYIWSQGSLISSRSRQRGLQYAVQGYITDNKEYILLSLLV